MKYPKLKCEEKKNTIVCSVDIQKMKQLRKKGFTYKKIADLLKIPSHTIRYHISPFQNTLKYLSKRKKRSAEYNNQRYKTDSEFRQKMHAATKKHYESRMKNDPKFKKWNQEMTRKQFSIWCEKRKKKYPNWSGSCVIGSHVTSTHKTKCKNIKGNCQCPCHK